MAKNDFQYGGWNYYTLQCGRIMTLISPGDCTPQCMWHVALESRQWIDQAAAPCNVIRGSGMTCHWIRPVAAPCNVTRYYGIMTLDSSGGSTCNYAPCNSPGSSTLQRRPWIAECIQSFMALILRSYRQRQLVMWTFDMEHDDFALDRTRVDRTTVLTMIFGLDVSYLQVPLLGVGSHDHEPRVMWQVAVGWHPMEFAQTFAILEFYFRLWFRPHHRSRHVILHQSLKFYPNRTTLSRKNDVMSIFKMADSSHLGFQPFSGVQIGFFEKPM